VSAGWPPRIASRRTESPGPHAPRRRNRGHGASRDRFRPWRSRTPLCSRRKSKKLAPGQRRIRRLTLFEQLKRSADSGLARQQIVNSNRYKLTKGNYNAEFLELTEKGAVATNPDAPARDRGPTRVPSHRPADGRRSR
jgi:hypothetical protein